MISQLDVDLDLNHDFIGIVVPGQTRELVLRSGGLRLNIPTLMSKIKTNEHWRDSNLRTYGELCFKNASACKPTARTIVEESNYILVKPKNHSELYTAAEMVRLGTLHKVRVNFVYEQMLEPRFILQ